MSEKARRLFDALDLDQDGTLTRAEVIGALRSKGPTLAAQGAIPFWGVGDTEESSALFDAADQNGDRVLSFEEFAAVVDRRFGW
ncbi:MULTISPECIES: EF-hand domain-containing protein [Streptomyces]|uniref:EF-hand domain-containing protein n=3 Tax=Streptomyces TaxID=1883 RepID=A0ABQ3NRS2_STRVG|nr:MULTISPECIES: EF-hand domain-containing protein [Streptomyces]KJY20766.1 EF hand [Streptomyces sp. NRRL S-104]KOU33603.1 EF hand [Streptomyces sp. WM6373]KOU66142.1 EF hand [Streptomyces sp. IGB124]KOU74735.1 EF hand [Streptomyces sp. XY66]KOU85160.1 EF hand [Streptomyces sp. XY593]